MQAATARVRNVGPTLPAIQPRRN
ncbi:exosporium leader peptide-containing protein [Akkermansia massiliensis]|nr:exosporium leader peptide-containing protein [Akkermansia muciniphila]MBT9603568.1 exosporium leader peptide-containing protein [Akkermansia muciniphila]QWP50059.1 exosporium leader peptide-containing protein [Akkermansia massiliensis]QWP50094.1 exosporium leader peptide-containing protein [Akkermansia massiliensis]QWP69481.1 exosporium leader peptide-containing protein [Akkermansia massiliensis]